MNFSDAAPPAPDAVSDARRPGRARVLATIRHAGQIARVDIARETGISPATVTAITAELLSEGLIEDELFGHEAGAFTGATSRRVGPFEYAVSQTLSQSQGDVAGYVAAERPVTLILLALIAAGVLFKIFRRKSGQSAVSA